jgi:serine/threonine protein kinase
MSGEDTDRALWERRVGTTIRGKYRLDRLIGIGGMAGVYAATNISVQRPCALKLLHPSLSLIPELRARFLREGRIANTVQHTGALDVLDTDVGEDGAAFLVMELLEGASVEQMLERNGGKLDLHTAMTIANELLAVLAAAHAKGIVHRDIKPANLFVTREGRLKVLDFGIARVREGSAEVSATRTGMTMGTPASDAGNFDLFVADRVSGVVTGVRALEAVNSTDQENHPIPSFDQTALYFSRPDQGDDSRRNIFVARRQADAGDFGSPRAVTELNTDLDEFPSWISPDNCRLYFLSNRPVAHPDAGSTGVPHRAWFASRQRH